MGADGHAEVVASPLTELCAAGDLPLQPALMGHLVPQQLNLWMGAAQQGALQAFAFGTDVYTGCRTEALLCRCVQWAAP